HAVDAITVAAICDRARAIEESHYSSKAEVAAKVPQEYGRNRVSVFARRGETLIRAGQRQVPALVIAPESPALQFPRQLEADGGAIRSGNVGLPHFRTGGGRNGGIADVASGRELEPAPQKERHSEADGEERPVIGRNTSISVEVADSRGGSAIEERELAELESRSVSARFHQGHQPGCGQEAVLDQVDPGSERRLSRQRHRELERPCLRLAIERVTHRLARKRSLGIVRRRQVALGRAESQLSPEPNRGPERVARLVAANPVVDLQREALVVTRTLEPPEGREGPHIDLGPGASEEVGMSLALLRGEVVRGNSSSASDARAAAEGQEHLQRGDDRERLVAHGDGGVVHVAVVPGRERRHAGHLEGTEPKALLGLLLGARTRHGESRHHEARRHPSTEWRRARGQTRVRDACFGTLEEGWTSVPIDRASWRRCWRRC